MTLKERMTNELKKLYSNLGIPEVMLNSVVGMAIIGLDEGCEDSVIESRAKEGYISDALKSFQSTLDKARTDAQRAAEERTRASQTTHQDEKPAWLQDILDAHKQQTEALTAKITALETANTARQHGEMVDKVAKELGLSGAVLDLCKAGLSSDMDETAIRTKLGAAKKTLMDSGVKIGDEYSQRDSTTEDKAMQEEAEKWVKEQAQAVAGS